MFLVEIHILKRSTMEETTFGDAVMQLVNVVHVQAMEVVEAMS